MDTYKIILVGGSKVGKTSLLRRFRLNDFILDDTSNVGIECGIKTMTVDDISITVKLWDSVHYPNIRSVPLRNFDCRTNGIIIVYNIASHISYEESKRWLVDLRIVAPRNAVLMLVGNKTDLDARREVSTKEACDYAYDNGLLFIETSALNGSNIDDMMEMLVHNINGIVASAVHNVELNKPAEVSRCYY